MDTAPEKEINLRHGLGLPKRRCGSCRGGGLQELSFPDMPVHALMHIVTCFHEFGSLLLSLDSE